MTTKNPYRKRSHLSVSKTRELIKYFCIDITASRTAILCKINPNTAEDRYNYLREVIHDYWARTEEEMRSWTIEMDESYFWARRVRWKRWRWAGGKVKVFWLLKRNGKVYTRIVPDCSAKSLIPIIRGKIKLEESTINTDYRASYEWLVDLWAKKHHRVKHSENEFARGNQHVNWIESFRSYCKRRLTKFNWIKHEYYDLYIKECERRYNCWLQNTDMYKELLKLCRCNPIYSLN
jgi:transposase-like protein